MIKYLTFCLFHLIFILPGLKQNIRNEIAIEPFLSIVNFESENFCPDVDPTKACLAFGDRAIPKIVSMLFLVMGDVKSIFNQ